MADSADGTVKINVQVMLNQALKGAKELEGAYKGVNINHAMNKQLDELVVKNGKASASAINLSKKVATTDNEFNKQQAQLKSTSKYFNNLSAAQQKTGNQYQSVVSKQKALQAESQRLNNALVKQKSVVQDNTLKYGKNSEQVAKASNKYRELEGQQAKVDADTRLLNKSVGSMTPRLAQAADRVNLLSKRFTNAGQKMTSVGDAMSTRVTLPIVAGMGLATKAASDYQYQLQDIRKEVQAQGYTASQTNAIMKNLSSQTLNWSKKFGVGTKEINDGMYELVSNGYNVKQAMGMMPELLKTMTANSDRSGLSIKLTSSMLEQFGMNLGSNNKVIKNGNKIMNQMTEATHKSGMSLNDLKEISGNAGASMHAMGISTNDFLAVSGRLRSAGIDASSVGTGLSAMMTRLGTGTGQAAADLKKYNIQVFDSTGKMKPLFNILGQMQKAYKGMNQQEQQKFMYDTIGQENMKVGMTLMDANLGRYRSLSGEIKNSTGTVDKYNQTMRKTNQFTEQQFKSSLHSLEIEFGQKLLPTLTPIIKQMTNMITAFSKMDNKTQQSIIHWGLFAATLGPSLSGIGRMTMGIGALSRGASKAIGFLGKHGLISDISGLAAVSGSGTSTIAALGSSLLGLGLPGLAAAAAIGGIGTAAYFAIKAGKKQQAQLKQHEKAFNEFGANVDANTQKSMRSFNKLRQSANNDMDQLDTATVSKSKSLSKDATSKYTQMANKIIDQYKRMDKEGQTTLNSIGSNFGAIGAKWSGSIDGLINNNFSKQQSELNKSKKTMNDILQATGGDLSKMTAQQQDAYTKATDYIEEQTSAFGIAEKDQEKLYKAYVQNHGKLTENYLKKDLSATDKSYKSAEKAASSSYSRQNKQLKKMLDNQQITEDQYNVAHAGLVAKKAKSDAKANINWINTTKAAYDHYDNDGHEFLATKQKLSDAQTQIDANGNKTYQSVLTGQFVSRQQWLKEAKEQNDKYIANQEKSHGTINKNLDKFEKSQDKAYKAMGLSAKQATTQAEVDRQELAAQTQKTASEVENNAKSIHKSYVKGLKDGSINSSQAAKDWGLDLSNETKKINLGKYGKMTAKQFWDEFSSGSNKGYEEAKVYFQNDINKWKKDDKKSIKDLSKSDINELKSGLSSGVVSLNQLKPVFGKSVLDLFPRDLSKASEEEIKTLKSGFETGAISLNDLKKRFGDKIYQLFPDDLSSVSKKELKTLKDGLKNGSINKVELKKKYTKDLNDIYKQDLGKLGNQDIKSLQSALSLGITNKDQLKKQYGKQLDDIYKQTPKLNGISAQNIGTLQNAMKLGLTNPKAIEKQYQGQLNKIYKKDLSHMGKKDIETLGTGLELGLPGSKQKMKKISSSIDKGAKVNLKGHGKQNIDSLVKGMETGKISVTEFNTGLKKLEDKSTKMDESKNGKKTVDSFSSGMNKAKKWAKKTGKDIMNNVADAFDPGHKPHDHGKKTTDNYANGVSSGKSNANDKAKDVKDSSESNLTPTGKPHSHGSKTTQDFGKGIIDWIKNPTDSAHNVNSQTEDQFSLWNTVYKHGQNKSISLSNGISNMSSYPISAALALDNGVNDNFNDGIDSANNISDQLGSKKKYKKHTSRGSSSVPSWDDPLHLRHGFANGTGGELPSAMDAIVGDGGLPELIVNGSTGGLSLSPDKPTPVHLPKKSTVYSGPQTKQIRTVMEKIGIPLFAGGTGGSISNFLNTSWDWIKKAVGDVEKWMEHPKKTWAKLVGKQFNMAPFGIANNALGSAAKKTESEQTNWLKKMVAENVGNPGGAGVQRWKPFVKRALALNHLSTSAGMINKVLRQIQTESGGNPAAIGGNDGLADGNAMGLMQTKPGTFSAYAFPGHKNILNGFDSLLAGLAYAKATYGADLSFLGNGHGYDNGGHVMSPQIAPIAEKNDEFVINPRRKTAIPYTNDLLKEIDQYQPEALKQLVLPAKGVTPEMASGYRPNNQPATYASVNPQATKQLAGNINNSSNEAIDKLSSLTDKLLKSVQGNTTINLNLDGQTLATIALPKLEMLLQRDINADLIRKGIKH